MPVLRWSGSLLLSFLAACGGRDAATTDAPVPDDASSPPAAAAAPVELTDKLMEQYVEILKEMKRAGAAGNMAFLTRYGWNMERWISVSTAVSSGLASAGKAQLGDAAAKALPELEAQIKAAEQRLAAASGDEKAMIQEQIAGLREMVKGMAQNTEGVTDLDRRSAEVLQRWIPRIQAIDDK